MVNKIQDPIKIEKLDTFEQVKQVEELQRKIWTGSEIDIVPAHLLITCALNGGLIIGAYDPSNKMVGFVFGFPGIVDTGSVIRIKHCSHMLGVIPENRDMGIGFRLKQAQWKEIKKVGIELITWTYSPLQTRNAHLNICNLGGISNTYKRDVYGNMRDDINSGLPSDRLQIDLWANSKRVEKRMAGYQFPAPSAEEYLQSGAVMVDPIINSEKVLTQFVHHRKKNQKNNQSPSIVIVQVPLDFNEIKRNDLGHAVQWSSRLRYWLEHLFALGYYVKDFAYAHSDKKVGYYVLIDDAYPGNNP